jgi:hypothetical protein
MKTVLMLMLMVLTLPARADEGQRVKPKNVPPHVFEEQKVSGDMPHLPDAVKAAAGSGELVWMGKVCAGVDGEIAQVSVVSGIPGADDAITTVLRGWRLRPQEIPICTLVRFVFTVRRPKQP